MRDPVRIVDVPRKVWEAPKPGEPEPIATLLDGQDLITPGPQGAISGSERITILVQNYRPGGAHVVHAHDDYEQVFFVLRGKGEFTLGDGWFEVSEGDLVFAPRGVAHAARNAGEEEMVIIFISVPLSVG